MFLQVMDSLRAVKPFDSKIDASQLATEWRRWKRGLEYYLEASGIVGQREKRSQLLYLGGPDLQDIFDSLPGVNEVPHVSVDPPFYDVAIAKLDEHFQPSQRRTYERYVFRQIAQHPGERFNDFVMKLRVQAARCEFNRDGGSVMETMIIDQIAEKCLSAALRKKILEKDRSLDEVVAMGKKNYCGFSLFVSNKILQILKISSLGLFFFSVSSSYFDSLLPSCLLWSA